MYIRYFDQNLYIRNIIPILLEIQVKCDITDLPPTYA